ncbi:MAG: DMT family transporter [Zoogloeaceae bacterium]|nr:DMT family transporter [Zoogloeaceae bacterium]
MNQLGWIFAVLSAVGFSFKAILVKLAYRHGVDAETLLALRMSFSLPFFLAMGWRARNSQAPLAGRDWAVLFGLGFLGYYLASYLDFLGLRYITAALERLILFLYPTLVIVWSAIFLHKPITRRILLAMGLCYGGIGLAVTHDIQVAGDQGMVVLGCLLVFGSAVSYALFLMGNGEVVGRLGAARVTAVASSVACLLSIGQFLVLRPVERLMAQPSEVHGLALAMAVFATVLPVWLLAEALRRIGAGSVALTSNLGPVGTMLLGWLLLGEAISGSQLLGAALVIGGVGVMARR